MSTGLNPRRAEDLCVCVTVCLCVCGCVWVRACLQAGGRAAGACVRIRVTRAHAGVLGGKRCVFALSRAAPAPVGTARRSRYGASAGICHARALHGGAGCVPALRTRRIRAGRADRNIVVNVCVCVCVRARARVCVSTCFLTPSPPPSVSPGRNQ